MVSVAGSWMTVEQRRGTTFDDLFLAEYARVVAIARRVLADDTEAEDVAQDVFCSYFRKHPPDAPFAAAWLHRAAAHAALNVIRERKRRRARETRNALHQAPLHREADLDPQVALATQERRAELRSALARLPEKTAAVLALRYSGLSYAEVAAALGVRITQVGTLLRRAEAALKKEMIDATPR